MCMFAEVCVDCLSCCLTSTEVRWPIRDGDRVGRGWESERLDRGNHPKKTGETVDRRQNNGSVKAVSPRHCPATCAHAIALSTAVLDRTTKTMSVAPLLMNNLKQKTSNLLSPAPPPYSWSLLGQVEGPAPPPSSKISWSRLEPWQCWLCFVLCFILGYVLHSGEIAHKRRCYYYLSSFAWWPVHTFLSLVPPSGTISLCDMLSSRLALSLSYS